MISAEAGGASQTTLTVLGLLLLLGACGKSAQVPLQSWLLDAMEGPTPVSALIHAATMVTAGVYLIVRSNFIFDRAPDAQTAVVAVAVVTLLWGAIIGCAKDDIKKVLAGSTMSQIGYMMLGAGLGVAGYAFAIFHLLTHGFFKANMFLGAGSVMHAMDDEVDMRHYGALRRMLPVTFLTFAMGYLAIIGFPGFSGFWSKDKIIETALADSWLVGGLAMLGAGITGFYMTRLMLMTFFTDQRWPQDAHPHESPKVMTVPLIVLAALSVLGGVMLLGDWIVDFLAPVVGTPVHHDPPVPALVVTLMVVAIVAVGVTTAWFLVGKRPVPKTAPKDVSFATRAARVDLYGDAINDGLVVNPGRHLTSGLLTFDKYGVDGALTGGPIAVGALAGQLRKVQNGFVRTLRPVRPRRRPARRPGSDGGEPRMNDFPWLTVLIVVPLAGALVTAFLPRTTALPKQVGLAVSRAHPGRHRRHGHRLRQRRRHAVPGAAPVDRAVRRPLRARRRRSRTGDDPADGRAGADRDDRVLARRRPEPVGVLRLDPGPRGVLDRGVRRDRRVPLLRRLRGDADPGVLPHRRLRPRGPGLRGAEVPDVPARRRPGDARRR